MRLDLFILCMSLMTLCACSQEQVMPELMSAEKTAAVCDIPGVFKQHECGLIITLEDGSALYATSYPANFKPQAGMAVKMAYTRLAETNTMQSSGDGSCGDGSCGDGGCGTSNHSSGDEPPSCMTQYGVVPILIQCITEKDI